MWLLYWRLKRAGEGLVEEGVVRRAREDGGGVMWVREVGGA